MISPAQSTFPITSLASVELPTMTSSPIESHIIDNVIDATQHTPSEIQLSRQGIFELHPSIDSSHKKATDVLPTSMSLDVHSILDSDLIGSVGVRPLIDNHENINFAVIPQATVVQGQTLHFSQHGTVVVPGSSPALSLSSSDYIINGFNTADFASINETPMSRIIPGGGNNIHLVTTRAYANLSVLPDDTSALSSSESSSMSATGKQPSASHSIPIDYLEDTKRRRSDAIPSWLCARGPASMFSALVFTSHWLLA